MPVLKHGPLTVDYTDEGEGQPVILVHSSVSANRQWRALSTELKSKYRVVAINLFGYGETTPWPPSSPQTLYAQAQLVSALVEAVAGPEGRVSMVGHSCGGAIAMKTALLLGDKVEKLILIEPNSFFLLKQHGRSEAFMEARTLRDHVKCYGSLGDWVTASARFADYWLGDGTWAAMPDKRRATFVVSLPPVFHEWDAVFDEETTVDLWRGIAAKTLLISDPKTRRPIQEIIEILRQHCPHWSYAAVNRGGHMAVLTHPEEVNPIIGKFLAGEQVAT